MRLFRSVGQKTLASLERVLVTTLVSSCYHALILMDTERDFFVVSVGRR